MGELHQVSSASTTRAWLLRALRLAASRVLPGLEEAVRASWVYPQKVLVIYGFLTRFFGQGTRGVGGPWGGGGGQRSVAKTPPKPS